jgi:hypothetical protein
MEDSQMSAVAGSLTLCPAGAVWADGAVWALAAERPNATGNAAKAKPKKHRRMDLVMANLSLICHSLQSKKESTNVTNRTNYTKKTTDYRRKDFTAETVRLSSPKPAKDAERKRDVQLCDLPARGPVGSGLCGQVLLTVYSCNPCPIRAIRGDPSVLG